MKSIFKTIKHCIFYVLFFITIPLTAQTAYSGFDATLNSGTGWAGNWTDTGGWNDMISTVNSSGLTFGLLVNNGGSKDCNNESTRNISPVSIADGDSLCFSYLLKENAKHFEFRILSDGSFTANSGHYGNNHYIFNGSNWVGSYTSNTSTAYGTTTFNLIVLKRVGANYVAKRFVYANPAKLPTTMPSIGIADAFYSGTYTSSNLADITNIDGIQTKMFWGDPGKNLIDEIRVGHTFADVCPRMSIVDNTAPTVPTGLTATNIKSSVLTFNWTASTDAGSGVASYEVFLNDVLHGSATSTIYTITNLNPLTEYNIKVRAMDVVGNLSDFSTLLVVSTSANIIPSAYSDFTSTINSGTGWSGNWTDTGGWNDMISTINATGLTFGALNVSGGSKDLAHEMTRNFNATTTIATGDSICFSYLLKENAKHFEFRILSNGLFYATSNHDANSGFYNIVGSNWVSSNTSTSAAPYGTTTFNLIVLKRIGTNYTAKRFVYTDPTKLPARMPALGDANAFYSGSFSSTNLNDITDIRGIQLKQHYNDPCGNIIDEIRIGHSFSEVAFRNPPVAPTNLSASILRQSSFTLSWTVNPNDLESVDQCEVFKDGVSIGSVVGNSMKITGLSPATTYNFTIKAKIGTNIASPASTALSVTTTAADVQAPTVPEGLNATVLRQSSFTLNWGASTDNVELIGYEVFKDNVSVGTTTNTSMNITGLTPSTTNSMTVKAIDAVGNISTSAPLSVTTTIADIIPPTQVTNVIATKVDFYSVSLAWDAAIDNVDLVGYEVLRNGTTSCGITTGTSIIIYGLEAGETYSFTVKAKDAQNNISTSLPYLATTTSLPPSDRINQIGINTGDPGVDYNTDKYVADAYRSARHWTLFDNPGGYYGDMPMDENLWPTKDGQLLVYHGLDTDDNHGTYKISFNGQADVEGTINKVYDAENNKTTMDLIVAPNPGWDLMMFLNFRNTKRTAASPLNTGVTNIKIMRPIVPGSNVSYPEDRMFTDQVIAKFSPFKNIRYLGWTATNFNGDSLWTDRCSMKYHNWNQPDLLNRGYNGEEGKGSPWEALILFANQNNKDAWINIPANATDDYIRKLAQLFMYGSDGENPYTSPQANPIYPPLNSNLKLTIEYSNEIWNFGFGQFFQCLDKGKKYGHPLNFDGETNDVTLLFRYQALRTAQISEIFRSVVGDAQMMTRFKPVIMSQKGYFAIGGIIMSFLDRYFNKSDSRSDCSESHPVNHYIYAFGCSGYWDCGNDVSGITTENLWTSGTYDAKAYYDLLAVDAAMAKSYGLHYYVYEADNHHNNDIDRAIQKATHWDPRMKQTTLDHMTAFSQLDGEIYNLLVLTGNKTVSNWGLYNAPDPLNSPQYEAIKEFNAAPAPKVTHGTLAPFTRPGRSFDITNAGTSTPKGTGTWNISANQHEYSASYVFRIDRIEPYNLTLEYSTIQASTIRVEYDGAFVQEYALPNTNGVATFINLPTFSGNVHKSHAARFICTEGKVELKSFSMTNSITTINPVTNELENEIVVFPNPTTNHVIISNLDTKTAVKIYSAEGKLIYNVLPQWSPQISIETAGWNKGVYLMHFINDTKKIVKKLIVK